MPFASLQRALTESLNLVAQMPILRNAPLETSHPMLARHLNEIHPVAQRMWEDAATEGRMLVADPKEVRELIGEPVWESAHPIRTATDIGTRRNLTIVALREAGVPPQKVLEFALSVTEAVTNALKHASGGEFRLVRLANGWTVVVNDRGPGIHLSVLPHSTLLRGYSTKPSLGLGFTAMLCCMDRLVIARSDRGTTILLQRFEPK